MMYFTEALLLYAQHFKGVQRVYQNIVAAESIEIPFQQDHETLSR